MRYSVPICEADACCEIAILTVLSPRCSRHLRCSRSCYMLRLSVSTGFVMVLVLACVALVICVLLVAGVLLVACVLLVTGKLSA